MATFVWPPISVTASSGPLQFNKNGSATTVSQDTVTPANSVPLPVSVLGTNGVPVDPATAAKQDTGNTSLASIDTKTPSLGQAVSAASRPVVIASDQSSIATKGTDSQATGTITASGQTVVLTPSPGSSSWSLSLSGTFSAGSTIVWEGTDDGTNWVGVNARQTGTAPGVTNVAQSTVGGVGLQVFRGSLTTFLQFRARCTSFQAGDSITATLRASSGTGPVFLYSSIPSGVNTIGAINQGTGGASAWKVDGSGVTQPISAAALPLPTGASTETTLAALNTKTPALGAAVSASSSPVVIATDQLAIPVSNPDLFITGQVAQTVVGNNILLASAGSGWTDVSGYRSASVQIVSTGTAGTFILEVCNDATNAVATQWYNQIIPGTPITTAITATASTLIYTFPIKTRYIRVRIVTTITGGSLQAFTRISQESWSPAVQTVFNTTAANLNATVTGTLTAVTAITNALPTGTNVIGFTKVGGKTLANAPFRLDYSATNVTTAAYVTLIASTTSATTELHVDDTGGNSLVISTGGAGSEVPLVYCTPGINRIFPVAIASGTRLSVKALAATSSVGDLILNLLA